MKIIISHDVDHLYASDHLFKDLILEKLWIRSFLHLCTNKISIKIFLYRLTLLFHNRMHRIDEVMEFDNIHHIPSIFFFGMDNVLGMSYQKGKAEPIIKRVMTKKFDVGVHGVNYFDLYKIKAEHDSFVAISNIKTFGVRNHYVRFNSDTFNKMDKAGYLFDSTWFNKKKLDIRRPYKVGKMWEFPLHIMDGYICKPGELEDGLEATFAAINLADEKKMPYCTILFHDYQFNDKFDPHMKKWYEEVIKFCEQKGYEFISYRNAIKELESGEQ